MNQDSFYQSSDKVKLQINTAVEYISQINEKLQELRNNSENEFLEIGRRLRVISNDAKFITEATITAAESLSGDSINSVIDELTDILSKIGYYLNFNSNEAEKNTELLTNVLNVISLLDNNLASFKKIIKHFEFIGISVRIEASRLPAGGHSFDKLINDINKLAKSIGARWNHMQNRSRHIFQTGKQQLAVINHLKGEQYIQSDHVLVAIQHDLDALMNQENKSVELARSISHKAVVIPQELGKIVSSLQFHDIVRQVIEHVEEVLDGQKIVFKECLTNIFDKGENFEAWKGNEGVHLVESCLLQSRQLLDSKIKIIDAINKIGSSLTNISEEIGNMSQEAGSVLRNSEGGSNAILKIVEQGIQEISDSLNGTVKTAIDLKSAIREIFKGVAELAEFITDIEEIGSDVELLAQNGLIKAAHLGEEGATLSTLADAIQTLSYKTKSSVEEISEGLKEIGLLTNKIIIGSSSDDGKEMAEMIILQAQSVLGQTVHVLSEINIDAIKNMSVVEERAKKLKQEIGDLIDGISIAKKFEEAFSDIFDVFNNLFSVLETAGLEGAGDDMRILEKLRDNYTMQREHDIHNAYLNGSENTSNQQDDDSNIELF